MSHLFTSDPYSGRHYSAEVGGNIARYIAHRTKWTSHRIDVAISNSTSTSAIKHRHRGKPSGHYWSALTIIMV